MEIIAAKKMDIHSIKNFLEQNLMNPVTDFLVGLNLSLIGVKLYINPYILDFLNTFGHVGERTLFWVGVIASCTYVVSRAYIGVKDAIKRFKDDRKTKQKRKS